MKVHDEVTEFIVVDGRVFILCRLECVSVILHDPLRAVSLFVEHADSLLTWILFDRNVWLKGCVVKMRAPLDHAVSDMTRSAHWNTLNHGGNWRDTWT